MSTQLPMAAAALRPRSGPLRTRGRAGEAEEIAKQKFTLAELDEEEAELEKLRRWHERIRVRDVHRSDGADDASTALERASEAVARFATAVFDRSQARP